MFEKESRIETKSNNTSRLIKIGFFGILIAGGVYYFAEAKKQPVNTAMSDQMITDVISQFEAENADPSQIESADTIPTEEKPTDTEIIDIVRKISDPSTEKTETAPDKTTSNSGSISIGATVLPVIICDKDLHCTTNEGDGTVNVIIDKATNTATIIGQY